MAAKQGSSSIESALRDLATLVPQSPHARSEQICLEEEMVNHPSTPDYQSLSQQSEEHAHREAKNGFNGLKECLRTSYKILPIWR